MPYFPAFLNIESKEVVVIGGGKVAERKVEKLLPFKPRIKVIAPKITPLIEGLEREGKLSIVRRRFILKDIEGLF